MSTSSKIAISVAAGCACAIMGCAKPASITENDTKNVDRNPYFVDNLREHSQPVISLCFSRDGTLLLSTDTAGVAVIWRKSESGWSKIWQKKFNHDPIYATTVTKTGDFLIGLWTGSIHRVSHAGRDVRLVLQDERLVGMTSIHASSNDRLVAIATSQNPNAFVCNLETRSIEYKLLGHRSAVKYAAFSDDVLITASLDNTIIVADLSSDRRMFVTARIRQTISSPLDFTGLVKLQYLAQITNSYLT